MPRKDAGAPSTSFSPEVFLRSINLPFDVEFPERIAHFQPTAKTVALAKALLRPEGRAAYFVVAPYGSGKSITASYVLQLIENRPEAQDLLSTVEERLEEVSGELAEDAARRRQQQSQGLALALHGHCSSLPLAIRDAALAALDRQKLGRRARPIRSLEPETIEDALDVLDILQEKAAVAGHDRILILWDEFGRHLESLIANARAAELDEIQLVAEYVSRSAEVPVTLGLLLHQDLLRYAGGLPQSLRAEWKKIEGRFQTLQFIDDSAEIYRLIGEIVSARRNGGPLQTKKVEAAAERAKEVGLFPELSEDELLSLLRKVYPLEPATLYLLPRLSARVAQNERTLFSFLFATDLQDTVGPERLYDYFSGEMRSDIAAGGTYRQYLETESALSKVDGDEMAARTLKAACLLGLGLGGERARASRETLSFASHGYSAEDGSDPVDQLIGQKLLLYRKHADQVAVWHGTDVDLRGRLEEEMRRRAESFDFVPFLSRQVPPPYWRPLRYNDDFQLRRYFAAEYRSGEALEEYFGKELSSEALPLGCDGKVVYVMPSEEAELEALRSKINKGLRHPQVLMVLPRTELDLHQAALELWCLHQLKQEGELTASDPLLESELDQMADDARQHLQQLVDRFVTPSPQGAHWFHRGKELELDGVRDLRSHLSGLMRRVFPKTPRLNNELIVKIRPSSVIVNARKKLILGILERTEQDEFGLKGNGPHKSMFYTLLINTGLFREEDDGRWAQPDQIEDEGLRAVWARLRNFFTKPSSDPKEVTTLFEELQAPPFGVRRGVLPILFAAGLKAFPSIRALVRKGEYVEDILASDIEAVCHSPEDHRLLVQEIDQERERYLREILRLFDAAGGSTTTADLIRQCYDALIAWREDLPPGALATRALTPKTLAFQTLLNELGNPLELFFQRLPEALETDLDDVDGVLTTVQTVRDELLQVEDRYEDAAAATVRETLRLGTGRETELRPAASRWAGCFPSEFVQSLNSAEARGLLTRLALPYETDADLLGSLASLLLGKAFNRWEDSTVHQFEQKLRTVVQQIESDAMSSQAARDGGEEALEGLAALVTGRLENQVEQLVALVGTGRARDLIEPIMAAHFKEEF